MKQKKLYDIFSHKKLPEKKEQKKKIIVDYRERNSLVASELISFGFDVEFLELKIGILLVNNCRNC
jgi:ERCC4-type nuclease